MGVYKLSTAGGLATPRTNYSSFLAGNPAVTFGSYESIATTTVGSGGSASIEFTSIPATYTHLQIRGIVRDTSGGGSARNGSIKFNGSSSGYSIHNLQGNGTTVSTDAGSSQSEPYPYWIVNGGATANVFSGVIIDILDYANTNKYKTVRVLSASDRNGAGHMRLGSASWQNTNAITSIRLAAYADEANLAQYSQFALYGIKGS